MADRSPPGWCSTAKTVPSIPKPSRVLSIRPLIEASDGAAAEVHHVEIDHAKLHYHERTDEVYYVIDGQGTMALDDETIELHRGVVVYVSRGREPDRPDCVHPGRRPGRRPRAG